MISERHAQRMHEMLADAASRGAIVVPLARRVNRWMRVARCAPRCCWTSPTKCA